MRKTTQAEAKAAVKAAKGNKSAAARSLGITRNALKWALSHESKPEDPIKIAKAADAERQRKAREKNLVKQVQKLQRELDRARAPAAPTVKPKPRAKISKSIIRVCIPDSHGAHIDWPAAQAMISDIAALCPDEIVWLGDHLDCGGTFSAHQRSYTNELTESYDEDVKQANRLLDSVGAVAPNARNLYLEGNHEAHVERWATREFVSRRDAEFMLDRVGPVAVLGLKARGFEYFRRGEYYGDCSIPGTIKLGHCYYTHGFSHSKYATIVHLERTGASIVHGHTHRVQSSIDRTVESSGHGAWCPGTLAKLQPLYKHTAPTSWSHGYLVQFVNSGTGTFMSLQVPIFGDKTLLLDTVNTIKEST